MSKLDSEHKKFLMSFFTNKEGYEEKKVNNHWLIKQWDGNHDKWVVFLYPEDSYRNYKAFKEIEEQNDHIKNL
jgi:hypothetical protein